VVLCAASVCMQLAATVYILAYYGLMLPMSCILSFPMKMGVYGIWYSMLIGTAVATVVFSVSLSRARYAQLAGEAAARMSKEKKEESDGACSGRGVGA